MLHIAYTKTSWSEVTPRSLANLNNLETQYDEAIADAITLRADNSKELRTEVLASLPAAGSAGRLVFNSTNKTLYVDDGAAWRSVGKSMIKNIKTYYAPVSGFTLDVTIDEVDRDYTVAQLDTYGSATEGRAALVMAQFTSDTNVQLSRGRSSGTIRAILHIIEYEPGIVKSIQRISDTPIVIADGSDDYGEYLNYPIASVNPEKCILYVSSRANTTGYYDVFARVESATNLRVYGDLWVEDVEYITFNVEIVEFY